MPTYKKGLATQENIINTARKLFYIYGYHDVPISQICRESNVKLGTFTYYFKKKEDLLRYIYTDYMKRCKEFVSSKNLPYRSSKKHIFSIAYYYVNIYSDSNIILFHKEILNNIGSMNVIFSNSKDNIIDFAVDGNTDTESKDFELFVLSDNAVRRELNLRFINNAKYDISSVIGLIRDIYITSGRIFGLDLSTIQQDCDEALEFVIENLSAKIRLL